MKKIRLVIILFIFMFIVNVKADMGPPMIIEHDVMVTNKDGARCYEMDDNGKYHEGSMVIPYKTTLKVYEDIFDGSYISVNDGKEDGYNCVVKYSDVSSKTQSFDLSKAEKVTAVKAVILAKGGINMRKGPSVTYSKIITVPQYAVVTLTHRAGDYWYYCEYNNHKGWITGMHGYFGYEGKEVLVSDEKIDIFSSTSSGVNMSEEKIVGKIPANTEITDYLNIVTRSQYDDAHYVVYKGVKGYIKPMYYKTDGTGKIKLKKTVELYDDDGIVIKKLSGNQELEYSMMTRDGMFRISSKNANLSLKSDEFEYIKKADIQTKTKGYIGEGIYGESKKDDNIIEDNKIEETPDNKPSEEKETSDNSSSSMSTEDIIIICLLGGILLTLTTIVIIKLVNRKKEKVVINSESNNNINEIEKKDE